MTEVVITAMESGDILFVGNDGIARKTNGIRDELMGLYVLEQAVSRMRSARRFHESGQLTDTEYLARLDKEVAALRARGEAAV